MRARARSSAWQMRLENGQEADGWTDGREEKGQESEMCAYSGLGNILASRVPFVVSIKTEHVDDTFTTRWK